MAQDAAKSYTNAEERERAELNKLNINGKDEEIPQMRKVEIDEELARLLKEAKMTLTLEDIQNTPAIMEHVNGLIPTLTQNDVTKTEETEVITYKDNKGGTIRTNSEYNTNWETWKAFDGDKSLSSCAYSLLDNAENWYLEYEFSKKVYATQIKYIFSNGSSYEGTRIFVIQGYNEESGKWDDLSKEITWTGVENADEKTEALNHTKSYQRYRLYVKSATSPNAHGGRLNSVVEMQLYGEYASKISSNTDENLKQALLANSDLEKITLSHMTTNTDFMKRLLDALSMQTVENNQTLMDNLYALIPTLTQNDVTKVEGSEVITYNDTKTGGTIRTNSEYTSDGKYAWKAFSGNKSNSSLDYACSYVNYAEDWYLEYEFAQKVYVTRIEYMLTNGSGWEGARTFVIQGYNEETSKWEDISEELTWTGKHSTTKEETKNLNYEKAYKRYRLYVKTATASNSYGQTISGLLEMQLYGKKQ